MIAFERALLRHADIGGLVGAQLGQLHADLGEMRRATFSSSDFGST
jgi:hypothetical protein